MAGRRWHLIVLWIIVLVVPAAAAGAITYFGKDVSDAGLQSALTNVATIGGIVGGLSLTASSILALSGEYREKVLKPYGWAVRSLLFGGFSVVVVVSLLSGVAVLWADKGWVIYVLAAAVFVILIALLSTAMAFNAAYRWEDTPKRKSRVKLPARTDS